MGIKYRALMSKKDYKKLPVCELTDEKKIVYVCDSITLVPTKKSCCDLFDYIDVVAQSVDGDTIKFRCDCNVVALKNIDNLHLDIEHKSKYTGIFSNTGRIWLQWNGYMLTIAEMQDDDNTETV